MVLILVPLPEQLPRMSCCTHLLYNIVLRTVMGMGMGMNVTAQLSLSVRRGAGRGSGGLPQSVRNSNIGATENPVYAQPGLGFGYPGPPIQEQKQETPICKL